jgi:hypothetical protein
MQANHGISTPEASGIQPDSDSKEDPGGFMRRVIKGFADRLEPSDRDQLRESFKARHLGLRAQLHDLAAYLDGKTNFEALQTQRMQEARASIDRMVGS